MNGNNDLVSIIVAAYNEEDNIENCVDSLIRQSYKNIEIIVINDGSTDSTSIILNKLHEKYGIIVYNQNNSGVSVARNKGVELAKGEWIIFSDADDVYTNSAIVELLEVAKKNNCDLVQGGLKRTASMCNNQSAYVVDSIIIQKVLLNYDTQLGAQYQWLDTHIRHSIHGPYGKIIKAGLIKRNNISFHPQLKLGEDLLFYLELLTHVEKIGVLSKDVYIINDNPLSVTRRKNPKLPQYALDFISTADQFLKKNHLKKVLGYDFNYQIYMHLYVAIKGYFLLGKNDFTLFRKSKELREITKVYLVRQSIKYKFIKTNKIKDRILLWLLYHRCTELYILLFSYKQFLYERKLNRKCVNNQMLQ